jgi:uncharacterized membrane protein
MVLKSNPKYGLSKGRLEKVIGNLLRAGVLTAAAVTLAGGLLFLIRYRSTYPSYHVFLGEPTDLRSIAGILNDALSLKSRGIIQLGLLLLIATPVARVVFSFFAVFSNGLMRVVLTALSYSLSGGRF